MNEIIKIDNLTFTYEGTTEPVLQDLSLKINRGDFVAIVGKNGSGKSTLLKLILKQFKPSSGVINIKDSCKVGYVEQLTMSSDNSFPASVLEIVMLGLYSKMGFFKFAKKKHKQLAIDTLNSIDLVGMEDKQINKLSGGQQQKVLIAKTLIQNPDLLILDEPTAGIDQAGEKDFFNFLEHLNKYHKKTIVMVTHNFERLIKANKVYIVEDKKLKEFKNV